MAPAKRTPSKKFTGSRADASQRQEQDQRRKVMVAHGRNLKARDALFDFLRSIDLRPLEWEELVAATGQGAPYAGDVLERAFQDARAVVVLLTPDDVARLRPELCSNTDGPAETELTGQARPNVLLEAGMGLIKQPARTILVQLGEVRPASNLFGRNLIKLNNDPACRNELAKRLEAAGCLVNTGGQAWLTKGDFSLQDFSPPGALVVPSNISLQCSIDWERAAPIVADALVHKLGPFLDGLGKKVADIFPSPPPSPPTFLDPRISKEIEDGIKVVQEHARKDEFKTAEQQLDALFETHSKSLNVLEEFYAFYTNAEYPNKKSGVQRLLDRLNTAKSSFHNNVRFSRVVALAHMASKGFGYDLDAKEKALEAANTCKQLDPDNASWGALLGLVYHWFGNPKMAIKISEEALSKAQQNHDEKNIHVIKNNLAYFYAGGLDASNRQRAIDFAHCALKWFVTESSDKGVLANCLDTLGFVKMKFALNRDELREARRLFIDALNHTPHDQRITDHIREINMKLSE